MPAAKRNRSNSTTGTKRKKAASRVKSIVKIGRSFPDKVNTTLRYYDLNVAVPATTTVTGVHYRANGIFDPYVPVGGHQPLGFDQWMAVYDHWVVNSSRIKVTFTYRDETGDVVHPFICGIYDDDDATNSLSVNSLVEAQGRSKTGILTTNQDRVVLYSSWRNTKTFGPATLSDSRQAGSVAADPSEAHNWFIWLYNYGNTANTINFFVDIEYNVTFFERRDLATS